MSRGARGWRNAGGAAGLVVVVLLVVAALAGCSGETRSTNGPLGDQTTRWGPPWRIAPDARASSKTRRTDASPCGPGYTDEETTCEGGACGKPPSK